MSERELLLIECDEAMRQISTTAKLVTTLASMNGIKMVTLFVKVADDQEGVADDEVFIQQGTTNTRGMCKCDECRAVFQSLLDVVFDEEEGE